MIKHHIKIAVKSAIKNKQSTFINIVGLAMGLACAILIYIWVGDELSIEKQHKNADQICQVYLKGTSGNNVSFQSTTPPLIPQKIKNSYPEILDFTRIYTINEVVLKHNERIFNETRGVAADQSVFDIFSYGILSGIKENALQDPYSIVLTKSYAEKYFGKENPIGKNITANNQFSFKVTAVIEDFPKNAYRPFDFIIPFGFLNNIGENTEGGDFFPCRYLNYFKIHENTDLLALNEKLKRDISMENDVIKFEYELVPIKETYMLETGGSSRLFIFSLMAVVVLLLACINYTNLSIGYLVSRVREISIKRVIGAFKRQLITQLITESVVVAFMALLLAVIIVSLLLNPFNAITNKQIALNFLDYKFVLFLLLVTVVTGLISGLVPAIKFARVKTADILKNQISSKTSIGNFRKGLVVFQFVITVFFLISTIVIYRQSNFVQDFNFGYNKDNVYYVRLQGDIQDKIPNLKNELLQNPQVLNVASASVLPNNIVNGSYFSWGVEGNISERRMCQVNVDYDYLELFGMELKDGRFFSKEFPADARKSIILNEAAFTQLQKDDAIGKPIKFDNSDLNLVGVIRDFQHASPLASAPNAISFHLSENGNGYLFVKINPAVTDLFTIDETVKFIHSVCDRYSPERPLHYSYLNDLSYNIENIFQARSKLIFIGTLLAILISIIGLFGLVFMSVKHRIKEIGIRKVNGATVVEIMNLISKEYLKLIVISLFLAIPLAWYAMSQLLQIFANKVDLSWWVFLLAGILAISIALLTVSWQSWRAATRNPVEALRYE